MGPQGLKQAVADAGPLLHLREIDQLSLLSFFSILLVPSLVREELKVFSVWTALRKEKQLQVTVRTVAESELKRERRWQRSSRLSNPDLSVLVLMRRFPNAVALTDDLELRQAVEAAGREVTGSVGLLVKGYRERHLSYKEMERAITHLLDDSSLYLSRAFRKRVLGLVQQLEKEKP